MTLGYTTEQIDRFGVNLLWAGAIAGAIALIATSLSAYLLYRSAAAAQEEAIQKIASANERAATAQRDAETEKLERLRLEERIAPRRIARTESEAIAVQLAEFKGRKMSVQSYSLDAEGGLLAKQLIGSLQSAGLDVQDATALQLPVGGFGMGLVIYGPDRELVATVANAVRAHTKFAISQSVNNPFGHLGGITSEVRPGPYPATILVGVKPLSP